MKTHGWILGALVAGGVVFAMRGCLSKEAPDERLAGRFATLCDIARDNLATPERGVRKLGHYLGEHTGDLFGDFGETIATIEKVRDDRKHDDRARVARDRLRAPLRACERDWTRFAQAVEGDPAAAELVQHTAERLNRTLEILLSGARFEQLPAQLEKLLEERVR
jgi:hypothetical protein